MSSEAETFKITLDRAEYIPGGNGIMLGYSDDFPDREFLIIPADMVQEDVHHNVPISVPEFNDDGSPALDKDRVINAQKHHFEWVTRRRWVTPWEEIGERETSEQFQARVEGKMTK